MSSTAIVVVSIERLNSTTFDVRGGDKTIGCIEWLDHSFLPDDCPWHWVATPSGPDNGGRAEFTTSAGAIAFILRAKIGVISESFGELEAP